jgi:hypothetical protein
MKFTKQEYADLHLLYGETRGNSRPAWLPYGERFPDGVLPSRCTFVELHLHICKTIQKNSELYLGFIDLEKAFDRIPRGKVWECIEKKRNRPTTHNSYKKFVSKQP